MHNCIFNIKWYQYKNPILSNMVMILCTPIKKSCFYPHETTFLVAFLHSCLWSCEFVCSSALLALWDIRSVHCLHTSESQDAVHHPYIVCLMYYEGFVHSIHLTCAWRDCIYCCWANALGCLPLLWCFRISLPALLHCSCKGLKSFSHSLFDKQVVQLKSL